MNPVNCSLTGVDARTDLGRLSAMAMAHPNAEFAILLSYSRAGRECRYPEPDVIRSLARRAGEDGFGVALHVCGEAVRDFVEGRGQAGELALGFSRVQLNFSVRKSSFDVSELDAAIARFPGAVITQHNEENDGLSSGVGSANHQILFDASLGRGRRPASWPEPIPGKSCGYAGGIAPGNVLDVLAALEGKLAADGWIDMETSLRDEEDAFDLDRCESVLAALQHR